MKLFGSKTTKILTGIPDHSNRMIPVAVTPSLYAIWQQLRVHNNDNQPPYERAS